MRSVIVLLILSASVCLASPFDKYVAHLAEGSGIDIAQVQRLWKQESGRVSDAAIGAQGEIGRAQIMLSTALDYDKTATVEKLKDKFYNTRIMFRHLHSLRRSLSKRGYAGTELTLLVLASYNRGLGAVLKSIARGHTGLNQYAHAVYYGPPVPMYACAVHAPPVQVLSCISVTF
jgi:hypothetical protein